QNAPGPPESYEVDARHEARGSASLRPEADAGGHHTETSGHVSLDLHPGAHVDLAEPRGHRRPQAVDDVCLAQGVPRGRDSARIGQREEDIEDRPRRATEAR